MIRKISGRNKDLTRGSILNAIIYLAGPLMVIALLHTTQSLIDMFWLVGYSFSFALEWAAYIRLVPDRQVEEKGR